MAPISSAMRATLLVAAGSLFSFVSAAPTTCVDNFSNGQVFQGFQVACGVDYPGGDLAAAVVTSFEECITTCKITEGCVDVSFVGGNDGGSCYMKSVIPATPAPAAHVWTAKKMGATTAPPVTTITCDRQASDGMVFKGFQIKCGVDYAGGDLAAVASTSFEACIVTCKNTASCVDVSYVGDNSGGSCYMKSQVGATPTEAAHVWTAFKLLDSTTPQSDVITCEAQKSEGASYKSANGKAFTVTCGREYVGGDLSSAVTESFPACLDICSTTAGCIDVSYVYGSCYMKSTLGELITAAHVWTGALDSAAPSPSEPGIATATGTAPSTTATVPSGPLSCVNGLSNKREYGSPTGGLYLIECGIDYAGGDLKATEAATFEACISDCDATLGCVDVSYVAPSCYLKSELKEAVPVAYVWTAKVLKAAKDIFAFPTASSRPLGHGTEELFAGAYTYPPAPVATLGPSPPPGLNTAGLLVLTPDPVAQLWYAGQEGTDEGDVTVQLTITYSHPSIVLEHSSHIMDVACTNGLTTIVGRFDDEKTYDHAVSQWSSPMIIITNKAGCSGDGQNTFFLAQSITFGDVSRTFSAVGAVVNLKDIFTTMDADFGQVPTEVTPTTSAACGAPTGETLNGLTAVPCGEFFDAALDSTLGYYSTELISGDAVLAAAAPNVVLKRNNARHSHIRRGHSHGHVHPVLERSLAVYLEKRGCRWWDLGCWAWEAAEAARRAWEWTQEQARIAWEYAQRVARELAERILEEARQLARRIAAEIERIARAAAAEVERIARQIAAAAKALVDAAAAVLQAAADLLLRGKFARTLNLPFRMGPPEISLTESPWGPAMKLYTFKRGEEDEAYSLEKQMVDGMWDELVGVEADPEPGIEVYCHKCAIEGRIIASGSITATPLSGLTKGQIGVRGNLYAGAFIGINAFAQWEKTVKEPLLVRNLAGWEIPHIISLGPRLILEAMATVSIEATGQLYTGVSLTWPAFEANLDFVDSSKSTKSGWTPEVERAFEVNGKVEAKAALGLPVTLNFGIDILDGLWSKGVNLTDIPAVTAAAEFSIDYDENGTVTIGNEECQGISWEIALTNEVRLDIDEVGGWTLAEWASPALASGCIGRAIEGGDDEDPEDSEEPEEPTPTEPTATPVPTVIVPPPATSDSTVGGNVRCPSEIVIPRTPYVCPFSVPWLPSGVPHPACATYLQVARVRSSQIAATSGRLEAEVWEELYGNLPAYFAAVAAKNKLRYYVDDLGVKYETQCNFDFPGSDIYIYGPQSWKACLEECSAWGSECAGAGWVPSRPNHSCYLKSAMNNKTPDTVLGTPVFCSIKVSSPFKSRRSIESLPMPSLHKKDLESARKALLVNGTYYGNETAPTNSTLLATNLPTNIIVPSESTNTTFPIVFTNSTTLRLNTTAPIAAPYANITLHLLNSTSLLPLNSTLRPLNSTIPQVESSTSRSVRIVDTTNTLLLNPSTSGNLFASILTSTTDLGPGSSTSSLSFVASISSTTSDLTIWGDSAGRFLHYYPSSIASLGVSRLRLANWEFLPLGAKLVSLVPFTSDNGSETMLVAIDTDGNYAWPFLCGIKGQVNKVFLVRDVDTAAEALVKADMKFTVTGGQASGCAPLALVVEG